MTRHASRAPERREITRFGPAPFQQGSWDARAAANFIGGGAGAGLIVFAALSGVEGPPFAMLLLAGLALIATGLLCVWHELGRPLRALHVFFHPRASWMTREAIVATLLFPAALLAAVPIAGLAWVAALLAFAFIGCQARMLQAARGIPAWREPLVVPLLMLTGLVEGGGLLLAASPWLHAKTPALPVAIGVLVLLRLLVWRQYRRALGASVAPPARAVLDAAGRLLMTLGTVLPVTLIVAVVVGTAGDTVPSGAQAALLALAGIAAAAGGAYLKYTLVTRAGFNQGFALAHLPVRGARP